MCFISESGPPRKLAAMLYHLMTDLDNKHWLILKNPAAGGWTRDKVELLFFCGATMLGNIIMRQIENWDQWPWPLRHLRNPAVPDCVKSKTKREYSRTCFWCREKLLTDPLFHKIGGAHAVLDMDDNNEELDVVDKMFHRCRASNQRSELQLGRPSSACSYRAGNYLKAGQLASRHLNLEHASRWASIVGKVLALDRRTPPEIPSNITSPWMLYFKKNTADTMVVI